MEAIEKINQIVTLSMIAVTLMFSVSCSKENSNGTASPTNPTSLSAANNKNLFNNGLSPWRMTSSGEPTSQRGIVEMSETDQTTCYGHHL